ncbi:RNA-directed DNA polymerase from mobile element jockey [Labeo rohita]|uniref:RNA-directed DNA polymerase from mobile element jockey n=1 Tax=Labeo rohita TaxID=84645 RepID=A0ABQ8MDI9_LABRO|nr:RNA-directed DNA polymerase from mobile element jockey [Labeo rohita]
MDPTVKIIILEQGNRSLEDHTRDFVHLVPHTHYPDSCLCTFYRWVLASCGSSWTVDIVEKDVSPTQDPEPSQPSPRHAEYEPEPTADEEPEPRATEPEPDTSDQVREPDTTSAKVECCVEQERAMESPAHCTTAGGELEQNSGDLIDFSMEVLENDSGDLIDFFSEVSICSDLPVCMEFPPTLPLLPMSTYVCSPLSPDSPSAHPQPTTCAVGSPRVCQLPSASGLEDPSAPPPASESRTPPRPSDPAAPPRLSASSSPPSPVGPPAPPGSLVPPAPPWSVVVPPSPRDSTPPALPRRSIPPALLGSSLPPAQPPSSVAPAPPRTSGSPPTPWSPEPKAPPWPSGSSVSPWIFGSPSPPQAPPPAAPPLSVGPMESSALLPPWFLPPSAPPWVIMAPFWVILGSSCSGSLLFPPWLLPPSSPPWTLLTLVFVPLPGFRPPPKPPEDSGSWSGVGFDSNTAMSSARIDSVITATHSVKLAALGLDAMGIHILNYIGDCLILAQSEQVPVQHRDAVLAYMKELDHDAGTFVSCTDRVDPHRTHYQAVSTTAGSHGSCVQHDTFWPTVHETPTVVAQDQGVLPEGKPAPHDQGHTAMPTCSRHVEQTLVLVSGPGAGGSLSPCNASNGRVPHRLGSGHGRPPCPWSVEQSLTHVAHKLPGDAGHVFGSETLSPRPERPPCVGPHRQHSGGLLHQPPGRSVFAPLVQAGAPDPCVVPGQTPLAKSSARPGVSQLGRRRPIEAGAEARGMDASPRGGEADLESVWPGSGGPLRNLGECAMSPLVLSDSSPGAGCYGTDVPEASSVRRSPNCSAPGSSRESASGRGVPSSSSPVLARLSLVLGPDFPPRRLSLGDSHQEGSPLFTSWCGHRQQDPVNCPVGLTHSTLKVYVAAIVAYHAPLGGLSVGKNPLVTRFLHGALKLRPPLPPRVPSWDLSVRVGDLQVLSVAPSFLDFAPGLAKAFLYPRAGYVPKVPSSTPRPVVLQAFCPPPFREPDQQKLICNCASTGHIHPQSCSVEKVGPAFSSWLVTSPACDISLFHWTDYTGDSERGHAEGIPIASSGEGDGVRLLLVAPFWQAQVWFSDLVSLLDGSLRDISVRRNLLAGSTIMHLRMELFYVGVASEGVHLINSGLSAEVVETILHSRVPTILTTVSPSCPVNGSFMFRVCAWYQRPGYKVPTNVKQPIVLQASGRGHPEVFPKCSDAASRSLSGNHARFGLRTLHISAKMVSVRVIIASDSRMEWKRSAVQCVLENFETVTLMDLKKAVHELKATICPLDAVPARIMKEAIDIVGPCLVSFINSCLSLGTVPTALKHAIVRPLLKKPNLDPSILSNFRPISHLPFLSKLMEKLVVSQLQSHLQLHAIADKFQSGFRSRHSTESALLRVHNDILGALDSKSSVVLVLLDLTAAFDTVDHAALISQLQHIVGLQGMVLRWFSSYLTNRTFSVMLNDFSSSPAPLSSGVPQGSILGPILFSLYMLPLGQLISNYNVHFHFYADDLQIYLPVVLSNSSALDPLHNCIRNIRQWLSQNFLHLNEGKTEYILFIPDSPNSSPSFGPLTPQFAPAVRNLGVIFDSDLEKAVHAFISSRLDYCNALYTGLNQSLLNRLQLVQNAAARLLSNTSKRSHISPVLRSLHWLPVRFRVEFKILMFVFKAINGLAPVYLVELVVVYQPARSLITKSLEAGHLPFWAQSCGTHFRNSFETTLSCVFLNHS